MLLKSILILAIPASLGGSGKLHRICKTRMLTFCFHRKFVRLLRLYYFLKMGHTRPLLSLFSSFQYSCQLTFNINFADEWNRPGGLAALSAKSIQEMCYGFSLQQPNHRTL